MLIINMYALVIDSLGVHVSKPWATRAEIQNSHCLSRPQQAA